MSFLPYAPAPARRWLIPGAASLALHGLAVALALAGAGRLLPPPPPGPAPEFTVTLERLDTDLIAGLLAQEGRDGAPDTPAETAPDTDPAPGPDTGPDAATPATDPGAGPGPDTAAPPAPPEAAPETAAEPPQPGPEPDAAEAEPAPLPDLPPAETLQPLSPLLPERLAALAPGAGGTRLQPVTAASPAPATAPEARPAPPTADPGPAAAPPPPASAQDLALRELIERIRQTEADPCLLALPRRDGAEGIGLELVAASDQAMGSFSSRLAEVFDQPMRQTRTLIDPRQCAALAALRQGRDYPATRLALRLDAAELPSGGTLSGVLRGVAGRYTALLLVDNNGVVQDLQRFLSFSGGFARFEVPVTRQGAARDTSQILLAVATDRPVTALRDRAGRLARDVFDGLGPELTGAAFAVVTFDVR